MLKKRRAKTLFFEQNRLRIKLPGEAEVGEFMQNLSFERLADLDCLVLRRTVTRGSVVLLHGYGADFSDLTSLADIIDMYQEWDWYFPNGPIEVPISP